MSLTTRRPLRAGPLSAVLDGAELRWIRLGDIEVLRGIYVAIRDPWWHTVPGIVEELQVWEDEESFRVELISRHASGEIAFDWHGRILGQVDGSLSFEMDGRAGSSFQKNRIGICVLHPMSAAGADVLVETVTGAVVKSELPRQISPESPFVDMRTMTWAAGAALRATVVFEGDAFEMEDQRNWTDASFKTFSTPLRLPTPVRVEASTRIRQQITLTVAGPLPRATGTTDQVTAGAPERIEISRTVVGELPPLSTCLAPGREQLDYVEVKRLRDLQLSGVRAVIELDRGWVQALAAARTTSRALGVALDLEIVLGEDETAVDELVSALRGGDAEIGRCLVFPAEGYATTRRVAVRLREALIGIGSTIVLAGGSRAYFAELNRANLPVDLLDEVCFPISPQVHAFDDDTVMENVAAQPLTMRCARELAGLPVSVGPLTLRPRFNPYGRSRPVLGPADDPNRVDARQDTSFAAAWTLASVAALADAGATSIVLHEATGPAGLVRGDQHTPLASAVRAMTAVGASQLLEVTAPEGWRVLALEHQGGTRVLIANLAGHSRNVAVGPADGDAWPEELVSVAPYDWHCLDRQGRSRR